MAKPTVNVTGFIRGQLKQRLKRTKERIAKLKKEEVAIEKQLAKLK